MKTDVICALIFENKCIILVNLSCLLKWGFGGKWKLNIIIYLVEDRNIIIDNCRMI